MKFYTPKNLDLPKLLEDSGNPDSLKHIWKFFYIVDLIYRKRWNKKFKPGDYFPIKAEILRRIIGSRFESDAKNILIDLGVIEKTQGYWAGFTSIGYRLTTKYQNSRFVGIPNLHVPTKAMAKIDKFLVRLLSGEHRFLFDNLQRVSFDEPRLLEFFAKFIPESPYEADYYERSAEWIREKQWFFAPDKVTGRVYYNITSLPKELRRCLLLDGMPAVEIDVSTCQPLLALSLYDEGDPEKKIYQSAILGGNFYELLNAQLEKPFLPEKRDILKQKVLTQIFFDRERQSEPRLSTAFWRLFPRLWARIREVKDPDYRECARRLQTLEADLMIKGVIRKLRQTPGLVALTIHDSVLTKPEFQDVAKQTISDVFKEKFGFEPAIKVKSYAKVQPIALSGAP